MKADFSEVERLEKKLGKIRERALPFASKQTVNDLAFKTQQIAKAEIKDEMILRNKWTMKGIQVQKTKTLNVRQQAAIVGSVDDYMERQEFGGTVRGTGKEGKPIYTGAAANQEGQQPISKLPTRGNQIKNIALRRQAIKAKSRKQRNLVAVINAVQTGQRYVYMKTAKRKGIYKVKGGSKKTKRGWPKGARLKLIWDMTNKTYRTPKNAWLKPSVDKAVKNHGAEIAIKNLKFQFDRIGL